MSAPPILRLGTVKDVARFQDHVRSLGLSIPCDSEVAERFGFAADAAALARRNQDWQPDRRSTDGRMGWKRGWKPERAYNPSLEEIRPERRETYLGRGSGRGFARRPRQSESTCDREAYAGGIGGIAKSSHRRARADDRFDRRALHRIAVDAFRAVLPPERHTTSPSRGFFIIIRYWIGNLNCPATIRF